MITRLRLTNFQSWSKVSLELSAITVVIGETDAGKSALLRGLSCVLFNTMEGVGMVRSGQSSAEVALETDDGHTVTWSRGANLNRYGLDGQVYDKPGRSVPEPVRQALLVHELEFDGESVRLQWAPQMDAPFLLADSGAKATRMLGVAGNAAITAQAARLAQQEVKKESDAHRAAQGQLDRLQEQLVRYADVEAAAPLAVALSAAMAALDQARLRRSALESLQHEQQHAAQRQAGLRVQEAALATYGTRLGQLVGLAQRREFLLTGLGLLQSQSRLHEIAQEYAGLCDPLRMQIRLREIVGVCAEVEDLVRRRSQLSEHHGAALKHYEICASAHSTLVTTLTCPTCGHLKDAA